MTARPDILSGWLQVVRRANPCRRTGQLQAAVGGTLQATLPGARIGERVLVGDQRKPADVFGFREGRVILFPAGSGMELSPGMAVRSTGSAFRIPWSEELVGLVLDAQGRRLDGGAPPRPASFRSLEAPAPDPVRRPAISRVLPTGVRAIDGLLTLGCGQRIGLFAGPGVGKSTLLGQLARHTAADRVVLCLVGERGRELNDFLERSLGPGGRARAVVVCATSDTPAGERARALPCATAIAEGFREQGRSVLLLVDSLTRHVRALREIALGAGEAPGRRGFPPSVFDRLAALVERTGCDQRGSITAVFTVLVEGDPADDPVAQEVRGLLDGHIVLNPELARSGCFPAIDPCASLSRLMDTIVSREHRDTAQRVRALWSAYLDRRDLIAAGAYQAGSEPLTDQAIELRPRLLEFIRQVPDQRSSFEETLEKLSGILDVGGNTGTRAAQNSEAWT